MSHKDLISLMDQMSAEKQAIATENRFGYIYAKAALYLKIGPEKYRNKDFFSLPPIDLNEHELNAIECGCKQIMEGKGLSADDPLTGLGINGFYILFELFHFKIF